MTSKKLPSKHHQTGSYILPDIVDFLLKYGTVKIVFPYLKISVATWKDGPTNLSEGCKILCTNASEITWTLALQSYFKILS